MPEEVQSYMDMDLNLGILMGEFSFGGQGSEQEMLRKLGVKVSEIIKYIWWSSYLKKIKRE